MDQSEGRLETSRTAEEAVEFGFCHDNSMFLCDDVNEVEANVVASAFELITRVAEAEDELQTLIAVHCEFSACHCST